MSSVTVLAVLREIQTCLKPKSGDLGLMAAFGPGFVAETALFEWQESQ
jgi:predicted naringenin-chalcone synthase